jgi:hypothetical protein
LLVKTGDTAIVETIKRREGVFTVYNIEVDGFHTYWISNISVLVHNKSLYNPRRPSDSPNYEVGFEAQLQRGTDYPGNSDRSHFQEANRQLHEAMQSDPDFAQGLESIYPGITEGVKPGSRGAYPRSAPRTIPETTWHHEPNREGAIQLIPRSQHRTPGPVQESLHPGGQGGMENWGGGR